MATTANLWRANLPAMFMPSSGGINWASDTINCALYTSTWTPTPDVATGYSSTNELATGSGYTQGGVALGSKTSSYTAANSYGQTWAASTAYNIGDIVRPTAGNGHLYQCAIAGTSGGSQPTWPTTRGGSVTDGGVTWVECGYGVLSISAASPSWTVTAALSFRYAAFYDATATLPVAKPFILVVDFGATQTGPTSGTLSLPIDANGLIIIPVY